MRILAKNEFLILCNGADFPKKAVGSNTKTVTLDPLAPDNNINLQIEDICRKLISNIPNVLTDLLEIATYVYCADQATPRGGSAWRNNGERWQRNLKFIIPVRNPTLWNGREIKDHLCQMLGFLSGDNYEFHFRKLSRPQLIQEYLHFSDEDVKGGFDDVTLFSGGLDSFAGAVRESILESRRVVLVSHRSYPVISKRQRALLQELREHCTPEQRPYHIPVWINKGADLSKEYTQRTRSFLFACLAAVVSRMVGLNRFKFYENGVVSFNLPISAQVIGARATRSTHPKVINDLKRFYSLLFGSDFNIENPFIWKTKADVLAEITEAACNGLIKNTVSCSRSFMRTKLNNHCGICSQCIDRRFAILSANLEEHDPSEMYEKDLFTDSRKPGDEVTMAESYVRTMNDIERMDDAEFFVKYPQINSAIGHLPGTPSENAQKIYDLYKKQAAQVNRVVENAIAENKMAIRRGVLQDTSLLMLVYGQGKQKGTDFEHSADFCSVSLRGKRYTLTKTQAAIARLLFDHYERGVPELGQDYMLEEVDSRARRLRDVFRNSSTWGDLIVPGEKKGTFRLNI